MSQKNGEVFILDGMRTPFLHFKKTRNNFSASALSIEVSKNLLLKHSIIAQKINEVIVGCAIPSFNEINIARLISLNLQLKKSTSCYTVIRNNGSGLDAIDQAYKNILLNRSCLVLTGGCESMSHTPFILNDKSAKWLLNISNPHDSIFNRMTTLKNFRLNFLKPRLALNKNLNDTADKLANIFNISREEADKYAHRSHVRAANSIRNNHDYNLVPLFTKDGNNYSCDDGIKSDCNIEKLQSLKPEFNKFSIITAGNSAQMSDGSAMMLLGNKSVVDLWQKIPLAKIIDIVWIGMEQSLMGLGAAFAISKILHQNQLEVNDIDYWEMNENFAVQVLSCLKLLNDETYCNNFLGIQEKIGLIPHDKLNINGGTIAIGNPIGASSAHITLNLAKILHNYKAKYGIAAFSVDGGQGGAVLLKSTH